MIRVEVPFDLARSVEEYARHDEPDSPVSSAGLAALNKVAHIGERFVGLYLKKAAEVDESTLPTPRLADREPRMWRVTLHLVVTRERAEYVSVRTRKKMAYRTTRQILQDYPMNFPLHVLAADEPGVREKALSWFAEQQVSPRFRFGRDATAVRLLGTDESPGGPLSIYEAGDVAPIPGSDP